MFYALTMITTRKLRDTPDAILIFGQILGALVFGAITAPFAWVHPSRDRTRRIVSSGDRLHGRACLREPVAHTGAGLNRRALPIYAHHLGDRARLPRVRGHREFWTLAGAGVICVAGLILLFLERSAANRGRIPQDIEKPILPEI